MPEAQQLADYIKTNQVNLDLRRENLPQEYFYSSLPLCVIDSVFSIGIDYNSQTKKIVEKWCDKVSWLPYQTPVHTVDDFIFALERYAQGGDFEKLASEAFTMHRVSPHQNAIRKAEAVYKFAKVLSMFGIQTRQDAMSAVNNKELEKSIRQIPGQTSGLSYTYFLMLAGSDDFVKADRHIRNFVSAALGLQADVEPQKAEKLLLEANEILKNSGFQKLTPRLLDYLIWNYQSSFQKEKSKNRKFDTRKLVV